MKNDAAPMPPKISHQYSTDEEPDIAMTSSVGVGRSAPKDEKICLNDGTTKIMITDRDHDEGHHQHRHRIDQRRLDLLLLQRHRLFR